MNRCQSALLILSCLCACAAADEKPFVHPLFSSDMVLQRGIEAPVWGWAEPGERIDVSMQNRRAVVTADPSGRWMASLGPFEAGGPFTMTITGPETVTLEDVMVGDVWICSGQSNMEWPVAASNNAEQEIAAAEHPNIRLFTVPKRISLTPQETVKGHWTKCSPETVRRFSAVGYFFGRQLRSDLDVPIGLIHTSWGGTVAEAWTSAEALKTMPDFRPAVKQVQQQAADLATGADRYEERMAAWWTKNDRGSAEGWSNASFSGDAAWKDMKLPANWENAGLAGFDGVVWFRRRVQLPADWDGKAGKLSLGPIDDQDTVWINGKQVGAGTNWNAPREYKVPAGVLKPGTNSIAIRVLDTGGGGGVYGQPDQMKLQGAAGGTAVSLAGNWKYSPTTPLRGRGIEPLPQRVGQSPNVTTVLYNGMLAPLVPFGIKGAIWYQGESNAGRAAQYRTLLPTMIRDWRSRFGVGEFPFLIVQLANFMKRQEQPVEPGWAELREAQWLTARNHAKTGLSVITDIGEANDIHPRNKQDVGKRLALQALRIAYGRDVTASGPVFAGMEQDGRLLRIQFRSVGGGLKVDGDKLRGFAIQRGEGKFEWADARIDGDTVVISSDRISEVSHVRYGWASNPVGNLVNAEGLPATPFRTDLDDEARRILNQGAIPEPPLPAVDPETVGMSANKLQEVKAVLQKFVNDEKVPGAIVAVARKGELVLYESVGLMDIDTGSPMRKDSRLRFYSMTKPVTSVAVMMLVEEGKLALDDPVSQYIEEFRDLPVFAGQVNDEIQTEPQKREFSIRDLLRHTSGLTYGAFGNSAVDQLYRRQRVLDSVGLPAMMKTLAQIPLQYQPGTTFNYSVSTDVLGRVVEVVSGQTLDAFFSERIFKPLRMNHTGFFVPAHAQPRFASTHSPRLSGGLSVTDPAWKSKFIAWPNLLSGGGGLVSCAFDYIRFCQMLVNGGELDGIRILKSQTVAEMTRNQLPDSAFPISVGGPKRPGVGFGLGFSVVVSNTAAPHRVGEYGWGGLASTHFWISPRHELAVVVLTQHIPFSFQLENAVKPLIYDAIKDLEIP